MTRSNANKPRIKRLPGAPLSLAGLRNLGPVSARRLEAVGIKTPEEVEAAGALEAYRRVADAFPKDTSLVLLYALEGALWDVHWNSLPPEVKAQLRRQAGRS